MEQLVESISRIPQLIVYGIISGSILTLGAIGLSLTYKILNFANFAFNRFLLYSFSNFPTSPLFLTYRLTDLQATGSIPLLN